MPLLSVPNISEGRDRAVLDAVGAALAPVLDSSADPDHHRAVFTLADEPGRLAERVLAGAREAVARIDVSAHAGVHPRVGAIDVAPVVFLSEADRGAALAEALVLADALGDRLAVPVFLYGELAGGRTRAELRRGGLPGLAERMARGEVRPDYGPGELHPTAGATLVAARPPLVAFNVELGPPADLALAREIAARIREGGEEGLPGVRALGLELADQGIVQVSTNIEDVSRATATDVVAAVRRHAEVTAAELIAPAPEAAFAGFPEDLPVRGGIRLIEPMLARPAGA